MWGQIAGAAIGALGGALGSNSGGETAKLPRHIRGLGKEFGQQGKSFANQYEGGQGLWDSSRLAGFDPLISQGEASILSQLPQLQGQLGQTTNTLEGFLDYDPNSTQNMARRNALSENIQAMFDNSIRPGIEDRGTFTGQFGGNQQNIALGSATAPLSRAMADAEVQMMEGDRNRAMQAMGMAPSIFQSAATMPGLLQQQIGGQRTARDQLSLEDQIQMMEAPRTNEMTHLAQLNSLLGNPQMQTSTSGNPVQGALGGGMLGYQLGSLFSQPQQSQAVVTNPLQDPSNMPTYIGL